jgi:hypothetical protein
MVAAYHAAMSCGVAVPLNPASAMDELRFDLQDFRVDLLLLEEDTDPMIRALATELGVPVAAVNVSPSQTGL